ncbi:MAG: PHP domain-containing protein [Promethearchaeota archaeon]|jgi:histidinol phosphatase-like PHP family hydrolase
MKKNFLRTNLHIHSNYSDGKNSIEIICQRALKSNLDYIAITDHFTDSWKEWVSKLKNIDIITEYLNEITQCQDYLKENNKKLTVLRGIEVDLTSSERFIKRNLQPYKFDLILFEYLQNIQGVAFVKNIINFWKRTTNDLNKLPIFGLAHFDPSYFIHENLTYLVHFLKEYNIYFEFNPSYPSYYSRRNKLFFERLREYSIPVGIGCDSHSITNLNNIEEPLEMILYYNLEKNFQILLNSLER